MGNQIFRKVSVERLSSPEQLDRVMTVVPAKNWLAFILLFVFIILLAVWGYRGEIKRQIDGTGYFSIPESAVSARPCVLASFWGEDGARISEGMEVSVIPSANENTLLLGQIETVRETGGKHEVRIVFPEVKAENLSRIANGDACRVEIIIQRIKPLNLLLP
ncbi:MAG: hypothetical protein ABFD18_13940 [Syntrophomonas sp.]